MTANIDITVTEKKDAVVVPWDSINETADGKTYVLVGDTLHPDKHIITTGILDGDNIEVTSGLSAGDEILVKDENFKINTTKDETKGFLQMTPSKRKSNKEILNNSNKKA